MGEYICKLCNYKTIKKYNYEKHLKSKKHLNNQVSGDKIIKTDSEYVCNFCNKKMYDKRNLDRHYETCVEKKIYDLKQSYNDMIVKQNEKFMEDLRKKDAEYKLQINEIEENLKKKDDEYKSQICEIEKDYRDIIKNISPSIGSGTTINNTINYNSMNMYYILKNFNDALDYDKIMNDPITEDEKKMLKENNSIDGCYQLIKGRCIDNIDMNDRPIHCVDIARLKFMIHCDGEWTTDIRGQKIVDAIIPKVYQTYMDFADDSDNSDIKIRMMNESINLMNNKIKVINKVSSDAELKNCMK